MILRGCLHTKVCLQTVYLAAADGTDDFENIVEDYRRFSRHEIPGGLKVCLVTEYGRGQACSDASEAIQDR
jgi:hypothetical protein